ncbi:hemin-degrading factor [Edaphovirga cremea]|uniref:hemin-degrading factor n=1 Tax=Edaphovirga cremea TaxID=2267246 RepID=UPI0039891E77
MLTVEIYERYLALKAASAGKYVRELASELGITEAELTQSRVGHDAVRLEYEDVKLLLAKLEMLGEVKALTRNEYAVSEVVGNYTNQYLNGYKQMSVSASAGLVLNPRGLDLRIFYRHWATAFALEEKVMSGIRYSIQFFDQQGNALHKIYATPNTDMGEWNNIVTLFASDYADGVHIVPRPHVNISPIAEETPAKVDAEWRQMKDVHDFYMLAHKYQLTRQQIFNCVKDDLAYKVDVGSLETLLREAKGAGLELAIFVANEGCVQITTGVLEKIALQKGWLNIYHKTFCLHILPADITECWVTMKPSEFGCVTSLEVFSADGTQVLQVYGQRDEHEQERPAWKELIEKLIRI